MRRGLPWRLALGLVCALSMCARARAEPNPTPRSGRFEVLTYNVAGLPEGLSNVHPVTNLPLIGARLNRFDLVLVQEDYAYPQLLRQDLRLPYQSVGFVPGKALHFGDGLSFFSKLPLGEIRRFAWSSCHGVLDAYFDCLTPKGLAVARWEVGPGIAIDVYNVHLDAGHTQGDVQARRAQLEQLEHAIRSLSVDRTVVVGGDFNLTRAELPAFRKLAGALGLADVCDQLRCGQPERLDRVLFRNAGKLRLTPTSWRLGREFRDSRGRALSDHAPVAVAFGWTALPPLTALRPDAKSRAP